MANEKPKPKPKKRGRKPKKKVDSDKPKPPPKKRGRKPKGGKIIKKNEKISVKETATPQNVVLHLKCSTKELEKENFVLNTGYDPCVSDPQAYDINSDKLFDLQYGEIKSNNNSLPKNIDSKTNNFIIKKNNPNIENSNTSINVNTKKIWEKLNILKKKLRFNDVSDKCSACFWCTYEFDNPAVYIPKQYNNGCLEVYGCFCSPECALSYLKNEQLDDSTMWERYSLLNNVYCKIYDYNKNIKPAPNPHYTLDKYYGNLSIQEYRKLLSKDRIFMVVNKPMTKTLPELYEENNEIPNVYNNILDQKTNSQNSTFRLKRSQQKQTKSNALTSTFGL